MAFGVTAPSNTSSSAAVVERGNYTTLNNIYDLLNKPDVREGLTKQFGNQMISGVNGLLRAVGATKRNGVGDSYTSQGGGTETREGVRWYEEDRLHFTDTVSTSTAITALPANEKDAMTIVTTAAHRLIEHDIVDLNYGTAGTTKPEKAIVVSVTNTTTVVVRPLTAWAAAHAADAMSSISKKGSQFEKGTEMPTKGIGSTAIPRSNTYYIAKYMFTAPASDMANVAWVSNPETGRSEWMWTQEKNFRERVEDYDEMMLIDGGGNITNTDLQALSEFNLNGSESLFSATESRGIRVNGYMSELSEVDTLIRSFDKQAGVGEYAFFVDRQQDQNFDNMLGRGTTTEGNITSGVREQFGAFANSREMALNLGFASFSRSSYTFHKHDWKLLNDPTLLGHSDAGYYKYLGMPMKKVVDPILGGSSNPILEINYKGDGKGYSRDMIHYITGAVPHADYNSTRDAIQFNYTCEKLLAVRGANNVAIGRGV